MMKLLNAGFVRVTRSRLFYLLILFVVAFALFMNFLMYSDMKTYGDTIDVHQLMLNYATIIGVVIAIFTSLFLGVEYSDGTLRNKIGVGHKRSCIYLSNLLITAATSLFSYAVFLLVVVCVGIPLFGPVRIPLSRLLALLGCILIAVIAYSAIFTSIAMLVSNKAITAIVCIMLAFGLMMMALTCLQVIGAQEFVIGVSMVDGEMVQEEIRNPNYPSEEKRKVYQFLCDLNPAGQMFQLAGRTEPNVTVLPFYSFGVFIVLTAMGTIVFNRKDIK